MQEQFVGTWKLVSAQFRDQDGKIIYPYGENAIGMIIYDAGGRMCVQLARPDRPPFASGELFNGSPEEARATVEGYLGYFGTYTVDDHQGFVTHHIQGCSFPNWMGEDQRRGYTFSGNRLTLSTPPMPAAGGSLTGLLIWERAA